MKLLHVVDSANPASGGPIEGVKQLGQVFQQLGHTVEVACADLPEDPWIESFPFPIHALGPAYSSYRYAPDLGDWLRRNIQTFDGVIVDGIWQSHSHTTHSVATKLGVEYFVFTHGMLDPWFKREYPRKHLKKQLYWRYGEYPVLRDAKSVLFTCEEEAQLALQSFTPNTWRSTVVSFGTAGPPGDAAAERAAFLQQFPELAGKRIVLFLGRIAAKKGVDLLLQGFAKVADQDASLHLVIAGPVEPELGQGLLVLAAQLGIEDRITWTGMLLGDARWGAHRSAEVFALTSHQENFGVSVAEALACGVPVLITDKVNIWREIAEAKAGLVEADTADGAINLLHGWMALTMAEKTAMSERARNLFTERFEIGMAARNLLAVITQGASK